MGENSNGESALTCEVCGRKFFTTRALKNHHYMMHQLNRVETFSPYQLNYYCSRCAEWIPKLSGDVVLTPSGPRHAKCGNPLRMRARKKPAEGMPRVDPAKYDVAVVEVSA